MSFLSCCCTCPSSCHHLHDPSPSRFVSLLALPCIRTRSPHRSLSASPAFVTILINLLTGHLQHRPSPSPTPWVFRVTTRIRAKRLGAAKPPLVPCTMKIRQKGHGPLVRAYSRVMSELITRISISMRQCGAACLTGEAEGLLQFLKVT